MNESHATANVSLLIRLQELSTAMKHLHQLDWVLCMSLSLVGFHSIFLAHLQFLDDVLVVPGVAGSDGSGGAGGGLVARVGAGQRVESRSGQHGADLSLQVQRKSDGTSLR